MPPVAEVILINPDQLKGGYYKTYAPPLGLAYLASNLEKNNISVKIIDMIPEELSELDLINLIKKESPKIIGLPVTFFSLNKCKKIAELIKNQVPGVKIVLGGAFPTLYPKKTLEYSNCFDFVLRGESEFSIVKLFNALFKENLDLKDIEGLCFNSYFSNKIPRIERLDALPFPAYHLLPLQKYDELTEGSSNFSGMITSRGCPYNCIFCAIGKIYGSKFRARSPNNIVDEIELLMKKFKIRNIVFWDDTFTYERKRVIKFCENIIERGIEIDYRIRSRVDCVDRELLYYLKESGCSYISYGIESGSQEILNKIRKGFTLEQVEKTIGMTHEIGIKTIAYFMIGNVSETSKTINMTIEFAKKLNPNYAMFSLATPFPGTDFFKIVEREATGHLFFEITSLNDFHTKAPLNRKELPKKLLLKLQRQAYFKFYFRLRYFIKFIKSLKRSEITINLKAFFYLLKNGIFSIPKES